MTTKAETEITNMDETEEMSLLEEEMNTKLFDGYRPTFHPALKVLKDYPLSALGISKDTKREFVRIYGCKNLYDLFTNHKVFLNTRLREKSHKELLRAIAAFVHSKEEILEMILYCPMIIFISDMLPKSDYDKMREDL